MKRLTTPLAAIMLLYRGGFPMNSDDGQVGKRACAAMTLIGLVVLSACSDAPRPKESELALSSYESTCG